MNPDTVSRCCVAIEAANHEAGSIILYSADESIPYLRHTTLAYFRQRQWPVERLNAPSLSHNSRTETAAAIAMLAMYRLKEVTVVTSWYHVPRVRLLWLCMAPHVKVHVRAAWKTAHPFSSLSREVLAILHNLSALLLLRVWKGIVAAKRACMEGL